MPRRDPSCSGRCVSTRIKAHSVRRRATSVSQTELHALNHAPLNSHTAPRCCSAPVSRGQVVQADAEHMAESIRGTCELAERVSVKVRQLDRAQVRVADTLSRLTAIADRMACLEGVSRALAAEDYEAGAGCVTGTPSQTVWNRSTSAHNPSITHSPPHKSLSITRNHRIRFVAQFMALEDKYAPPASASDSGSGSGPSATSEEAGQAADQRAQLLAAKKQLEEVMRSKFAEASSAGDHGGALRFLKLYPKVRERRNGPRGPPAPRPPLAPPLARHLRHHLRATGLLRGSTQRT